MFKNIPVYLFGIFSRYFVEQPIQFFSNHYPRLSVSLLSYDSRSTLIQLDCRNNGRAQQWCSVTSESLMPAGRSLPNDKPPPYWICFCTQAASCTSKLLHTKYDWNAFSSPFTVAPFGPWIHIHYTVWLQRVSHLFTTSFPDRKIAKVNEVSFKISQYSDNQFFFCNPVVLESTWYRTRAKQLINGGNMTGGLKKNWTGPGGI